MKGIDMIVSEWNSDVGHFSVTSAVVSSKSLPCVATVSDASKDHLNVQSGVQTLQVPQSIFVTQSIDDIAQLYIESPFSW